MDKKVLIIDDDESVIWVIKKALEPIGYEVEEKRTIKAGIKVADKFRIIFLDIVFQDGNGLDALKEIKAFNPDTSVIIITANGRMETVIEAMKEGAFDYLEKPFDIEELKMLTEKAFKDIAIHDELIKLKQDIEGNTSRMIGSSRAMIRLFKEIGRIAPKDVIVLISGESGTGKELVARELHNHSGRKIGPFVSINSASIPKDLLEAELFGWRKGAFTGASDKRDGKIQSANRGTLFLDEISEMNIELQAKLLRFLQEKEYTPLGSDKTEKADVRIIGATNADLKERVKAGLFREDLYYRFNVVEIKLPPLRDRTEDILPLANHFLNQSIKMFNLYPKKFSKDAQKALLENNWQGNVRELENTVKKASILSRGTIIENKDLFIDDYNLYSMKDFLESKFSNFLNKVEKIQSTNLYYTVISETERALFDMVMNKTGGNQIKAAKILGINRNTLRSKIKKFQ